LNTSLQPLSSPGRRFAVFAIGLTLLRIVALILSDADLGPDEGQYWFWSEAPAFGYFSKPPLVAWSIAATTGLFGDAEWAVRLSAPIYQLGAATFAFFLTRRLAGARAAFWAGAAHLTLPGVFLSSALTTTDAPLLFFWTMALYFFFVLTDAEEPGPRRLPAAMLGAAIGFGFLSKYAMSYFLPGLALALVLSPQRRRRFGAANAAIVALIALATFAPNIFWNAAHDFQTLSHTAANANWSGDFGHPDRLLKFLGDQFAIAGPVMLALIFGAALRGRANVTAEENDVMRTLLAFAIPALTIVSLQAFISRAHGNWAAVAYPSAVIMATIWALRAPRTTLAAKASVALHLAVGLAFLAAFSNFAVAEAFGGGSQLRRLRGWQELGASIAEKSRDFDAIMTDDREITGELVYYARGAKPIVAWNSNIRIDSHFEAFHPFDPERHARVLYVSERDDGLYIQDRFSAVLGLGALNADIGGGRQRTLYLFDVSGLVRAPD